MNRMNMPGYTADASLHTHRSTAPYFGALFRISVDRSALVQPQLRKTDYECVHDCLEAGGGDMCNFFCTENVDDGGGGGGGGGEHCTPGCGPCYPDPDSPMGGFRTCVTYNCGTLETPCRRGVLHAKQE